MVVWFTHTVIAEETTGFLRQNSICQFCVCALPNPGIELTSLASPALAGGFFDRCTTWEAQCQF